MLHVCLQRFPRWKCTSYLNSTLKLNFRNCYKFIKNEQHTPASHGCLLGFKITDISLISLNMRYYLLQKHIKISWQLIKIYVACNPNKYSTFWWIPVNNLERFLKKNHFKSSQKHSLVYLYTKCLNCKPQVPHKDVKNHEIVEQFALR